MTDSIATSIWEGNDGHDCPFYSFNTPDSLLFTLGTTQTQYVVTMIRKHSRRPNNQEGWNLYLAPPFWNNNVVFEALRDGKSGKIGFMPALEG